MADPASPAPAPGACDAAFAGGGDLGYVTSLRIAAVFVVAAISALGIAIPYASRRYRAISEDTAAFFVLKCFGAGIILATGVIHMFPDADDALGGSEASQQCLGWAPYPWAAMIVTLTIVAVMMVDTLVSRLFYRLSIVKALDAKAAPAPIAAPTTQTAFLEGADGPACLEAGTVHAAHKRIPTQEAIGLARRIAVAQVLEAGIAFHSVIIGMAVGATTDAGTVRTLMVALAFHQFFEGGALGCCLIEAGFRRFWYTAFALCFALTCPLGIALGIGLTSTYNPNSATALGVQGVLDAISAGILIYTSLVDLISLDVFSPRALASPRLQLAGQVAILGGAVVMGIIAIWA